MKDRNKILFVCNSTWGIYKFRINLIRQLIAAGMDVYVLAPRDRYSEALHNEEGLNYLPLDTLRPTSFSLVGDWRLYRELLGHYRRLQPDLIFHYTIKPNIYGSLAARRAGCLSVAVITGLGYTFLNEGWMRKLATRMYRFALTRAKEVWFLNHDDLHTFVQEHIINSSQSFLLPGEGVDEKFFVPSGHYEIRPVIRFLLIGRIIREKGIAEYVEAAASLKRQGYHVECLVAGFYDHDNPASIPHRQFFDWIRSGVITYLGASDDVRPFLNQADCVVLPSYSEGLPLTLLEAGCLSLPLIATDVPGCREIISHGANGYLCLPRNASALADAMSDFYNLSPVERMTMGRAARSTVLKRFTQRKIHAIYFNRISGMLGRKLEYPARLPQFKQGS